MNLSEGAEGKLGEGRDLTSPFQFTCCFSERVHKQSIQ